MKYLLHYKLGFYHIYLKVYNSTNYSWIETEDSFNVNLKPNFTDQHPFVFNKEFVTPCNNINEVKKTLKQKLKGTNYPEIYQHTKKLDPELQLHLITQYKQICDEFNINYNYQKHLNKGKQDELQIKIKEQKNRVQYELKNLHKLRTELEEFTKKEEQL